MRRTRHLAALALALAVVTLAGCGGSEAPSTTTPPATSAAPTGPQDDPYEAYLKIAPKGAPKLSREDALTKAFIGCGQTWAPGTVDAALATAYAEWCKNR
ncbi:hypothetical protein [Micromonospora rubida]|uniref:hypothetical protein n=1 Tax=Micromonospora rubida TaxID=2697657 RepID=UPI001376883C|nr:hypothetical protein [Micromonospora rubida]NBE80297.1 hypothetical protein [Micromonospora rubida]